MKLLKIILAGTLALSVASTSLSASVSKGQKLYVKKLKDACGFTGDKFAAKHSQIEWEEIHSAGKFKEEIIKICPDAKDVKIKDSWIQHIFEFSYEYANDSGNVPSC